MSLCLSDIWGELNPQIGRILVELGKESRRNLIWEGLGKKEWSEPSGGKNETRSNSFYS